MAKRNKLVAVDGVLTASEGKVLRRKESGEIFGPVIYLGYSHYIGGVLQDPPHLDTEADFEEIDAPAEETQCQDVEVEPVAPEEPEAPEGQ